MNSAFSAAGHRRARRGLDRAVSARSRDVADVALYRECPNIESQPTPCSNSSTSGRPALQAAVQGVDPGELQPRRHGADHIRMDAQLRLLDHGLRRARHRRVDAAASRFSSPAGIRATRIRFAAPPPAEIRVRRPPRTIGRMATTIADLRARAKTPGGKKAIRYTMVSVISVVVSLIAFLILNGVVQDGRGAVEHPRRSPLGGVPSYCLNRQVGLGQERQEPSMEGDRSVLDDELHGTGAVDVGRRGRRALGFEAPRLAPVADACVERVGQSRRVRRAVDRQVHDLQQADVRHRTSPCR